MVNSGQLPSAELTRCQLSVANVSDLKINTNLVTRLRSVPHPEIFLGIPLVTYLVTLEAPPWWALRGEKNLRLCSSRTLENAFPNKLFIVFCDGERQRKTKCSITIPWRALYFLPNRCLEISVYMFAYM